MDEQTIAILKKRAQRYAPPAEEKKAAVLIGNFVGCRVGEIQFAIPSSIVVECAPLLHVTPFAGRKHLIGITHLRGDVMALIDLLEATSGRPSGKCANIAIIQAPAGRFAIPVSEVLGMRNIHEDELLPAGQIPVVSPLIKGATKDLWFLVAEQSLLALV